MVVAGIVVLVIWRTDRLLQAMLVRAAATVAESGQRQPEHRPLFQSGDGIGLIGPKAVLNW
jgi:hypothetical protein